MRRQHLQVQVGYLSCTKGGFNDFAGLPGVDMYISVVLGGPSDDKAVTHWGNCCLQRVYISLKKEDYFEFSGGLRLGQACVPSRAFDLSKERL